MPRSTLRNLLSGGVSFFVGTVDADGQPTCCRAVALTTNDDFDTVTVYIPAAVAQLTVANVATTRRVAIAMTRPLSHQSAQIKGLTRGVRLAAPGDEAVIEKQLEMYAETLEQVGLPRRITRSIAHWPAFAIDVSVEQVFDQTPGPGAGAAIG